MVHLLQCRSSVHILLLLLFFSTLILTSSMEVALSESDARRLPLRRLRLLPEDTGGATNKAVAAAADNKQAQAAARSRAETEGRRALIGSRPPRCERVCMSCGHCEAVQVPIVPQAAAAAEEEEEARAATMFTAAMFTYRVDGITNYKPLSWKCRCGGTILDP